MPSGMQQRDVKGRETGLPKRQKNWPLTKEKSIEQSIECYSLWSGGED